MLPRISNGVAGFFNKTKRMFHNKQALKEMAMDAFVIAPYVATDALLYYVSYLNFLSHLAEDPNHPENASWYFPAYCAGTVIVSAIMAPALFFAFSDTAGRLFKDDALKIEDNEYRQFKYHIRRVIGIPGAFTKVLSGDASLYTYLATVIPRSPAIAIAAGAAFFAVPALTSFLWSNHDPEIKGKEKLNNEQRRMRLLKRGLAYGTSLIYAIDVGFAYYHSALNIPKNLKFLNHSLEQYQNTAEEVGYSFITIATLIETSAVFLAFARLNANMFGLVKLDQDLEETGCWVNIEGSWVKKGVGSFAVLFKVFNTAVSAIAFFRNKMPLPANIAFVTYSSLCGLLAQSSLLIADPLNTKFLEKNPDLEYPNNNASYEDGLTSSRGEKKENASTVVTATDAQTKKNKPVVSLFSPKSITKDTDATTVKPSKKLGNKN